MFCAIFTKGNNFYDFPFSSHIIVEITLNMENLSWGWWEGRGRGGGGKFFHLRVDRIEKGNNNEIAGSLPLKVYPFTQYAAVGKIIKHFKADGYTSVYCCHFYEGKQLLLFPVYLTGRTIGVSSYRKEFAPRGANSSL